MALRVDNPDWSELTATLQKVREINILDVYRLWYQGFNTPWGSYIGYRQQTLQRYLMAARLTPYAPTSIGTRKKSGEIRGAPGSLYGIDLGHLIADFTQNVKITDTGLEVYSDRVYAGRMESLFEQKGPFVPNGVLFVDQEDLEALQLVLLEMLDRIDRVEVLSDIL